MPTIKKPNQYFDATVFTGTGATLSVTNAGAFKPDFVWIKDRLSGNHEHMLFDSVRGATNYLRTNTTAAEQTVGTTLTAFNSNGFTVGSGADSNPSGNTAIAWQWQAGSGTTTVNTSGSISSNVSVNATAGFSVVTYTGNGSSGNVGHGLGVTPKIVLVKNRTTGSTNWIFFTTIVDGSMDYLFLNTTAAKGDAGESAPTSTTFNLASSSSNINTNGDNYVAYCWAEVEGYSKFGSYTGNASSDGPFLYTGFRPKFILIKGTAANRNWVLFDSSRNTYNANANLARLKPNTSDAEDGNEQFDFLSNGFKIRNYTFDGNANGETYIYMAFAEAPFKFSNAR